jgi:hypothetical protein
MRSRTGTVLAISIALLGLAACGPAGSGDGRAASPGRWKSAPTIAATPQASSSSAPARSVAPAAAAGPACTAITYEAVAAALGARLDVAASSGSAGHELVCVLESSQDHTAPDLTYVTNPVPADKESFQLDLTPKGAAPVPGLGKAAYRISSAAGEAGRATVEIGWLGKSAVYTLLCSLPGTASAGQLTTVGNGLIALAKKLPA